MIYFNKLIIWFGSNIFKLMLILIISFFLFVTLIIAIPVLEFFNYFFNSFNEFQNLINNTESFFKEFKWEKIEIPEDEVPNSETL